MMLEQNFDCVAVPLPPSFQSDVEAAIERLPVPSIVIQRTTPRFYTEWSPDTDEDDDDEDDLLVSYVPIDPCQAVIAALRSAGGEHIARRFIDLETNEFEPYSDNFPDAYALKRASLEQFAAALLPGIDRPDDEQREHRIRHMANRLRELEADFQNILFVCSVLDWPWIREAYMERHARRVDHEETQAVETFSLEPKTLTFLFGELPFITGLYERSRAELESDENLSIDGVKELLIAARAAYKKDYGNRARKVTPHTLRMVLKYVRNLSLVGGRLTPDLYSLLVASQQIVGDGFAIHVAEKARDFQYNPPMDEPLAKMGIEELQLPGGDLFDAVSRLPGPDFVWGSLKLLRKPEKVERDQWKQRWNPYSQCSWPPEDEKIENFRAHVFERALAVIGADLAKTEKFTTSVMDGIDIRETLRHWYDGDIYVKVEPPSRGNLDCVVMLFDSPADPRDYPWRTTWYAEHDEEDQPRGQPELDLLTDLRPVVLFVVDPRGLACRDEPAEVCVGPGDQRLAGAGEASLGPALLVLLALADRDPLPTSGQVLLGLVPGAPLRERSLSGAHVGEGLAGQVVAARLAVGEADEHCGGVAVAAPPVLLHVALGKQQGAAFVAGHHVLSNVFELGLGR